MSRRLNYDKRFNSTGVSVGYRYDPLVDRGMGYVFKQPSRLQREINSAKGAAVIKANKAKRKPVANNTRAVAEDKFRETFQIAVNSIIFGLEELVHIPNPDSRYKNNVNQKMLIQHLKILCNCVRPPIYFDMDASKKSREPEQ